MKKIYRTLILGTSLLFVHNGALSNPPHSPAAQNAQSDEISDAQVQKILEKMEYLRGFRDAGFSFTSEVLTVKKQKIVGKHLLDVKVSKDRYAMVEIVEPRNERGRRTLIREQDLWLYLPSSSNVIRIAPLQRVFGSASIADVLNTSFLNSYQVASKTIQKDGTLMLKLVSKERGATYAKINLSYDLNANQPIKTEHFTSSGRLLKTIEYKAFFDHEGQEKLGKIAIYDSLRKDAAVWIQMSDYKVAEHPSALFTKSGLKKT